MTLFPWLLVYADSVMSEHVKSAETLSFDILRVSVAIQFVCALVVANFAYKLGKLYEVSPGDIWSGQVSALVRAADIFFFVPFASFGAAFAVSTDAVVDGSVKSGFWIYISGFFILMVSVIAGAFIAGAITARRKPVQ